MCVTANKERNTPSKSCKKITKSRPQPRDAVLIKYEKIYDIKNVYYFIEQMHKY